MKDEKTNVCPLDSIKRKILEGLTIDKGISSLMQRVNLMKLKLSRTDKLKSAVIRSVSGVRYTVY